MLFGGCVSVSFGWSEDELHPVSSSAGDEQQDRYQIWETAADGAGGKAEGVRHGQMASHTCMLPSPIHPIHPASSSHVRMHPCGESSSLLIIMQQLTDVASIAVGEDLEMSEVSRQKKPVSWQETKISTTACL